MKEQRFSPNFLILMAVAVAALLLGIYIRHRTNPPQPPEARIVQSTAPEGTADVSPTAEDRSPEAVLNRLLTRLRQGPIGPGDLDAFRAALLAADPAQAVAAIKKFLATGQDALTGERFTIGPKGVLSGAPTLRILLLDLLGQISEAEAGKLARTLMQKKTTADEWAVALRNVAWDTPNDREYLSSKLHELIDYQPWRQQHSPGYYESFDVIVYTRDVTFIPQLTEFIRGEDEPLKNTAASALDRLATMAPNEVMNYLNANPTELAERPFLRSDYYTKADFTQPGQRAAVEMYLDRADVPARAKEKVIAGLGAPNLFVSDNLLTSTAPPGDETEPLIPPAQKTALGKAFNDWLTSNRYPSLNLTIMTRQLDLKQ
jgi:hypothetical protein